MNEHNQPYFTLRARRPAEAMSMSSTGDSAYESAATPPATHDTSRVKYHMKNVEVFAKYLEDSAAKAFPNRGRSSQRYNKVVALLLHWKSDDLFVLPELEDLERCLREDYNFDTEIYSIESDSPHLDLMMKIGMMLKQYESDDTLFVIYYGGHARIDESRQSMWCATRHPESPSLQWSAIQTLLERSVSDVLVLLDCCAGAASATFPNGQSITETISASSWDAIAPDPGMHSFTYTLIEVLQQWRHRTFSAAMLHAEVLARLKHPRPINLNGRQFEARATPVHFMMTNNHKAPSIEFTRFVPDEVRPPSPPEDSPPAPGSPVIQARGSTDIVGSVSDPDENTPHVMISLALEDDQRLDLNAWEQWLSSFPAMAKYVKVQGVFKSHSTLLLLSMPVMIWDMLPNDRACDFVAFIRSNNLAQTHPHEPPSAAVGLPQVDETSLRPFNDRASIISGTTMAPTETGTLINGEIPGSLHYMGGFRRNSRNSTLFSDQEPSPRFPPRSSTAAFMRMPSKRPHANSSPVAPERPSTAASPIPHPKSSSSLRGLRTIASNITTNPLQRQTTANSSSSVATSAADSRREESISRAMILNQSRDSKRTNFSPNHPIPEAPQLAAHVVRRLEEYFQAEPQPTVAVSEFLASNLGVETYDIDLWFHHRREQQRMTENLQNLRIGDHPPHSTDGARMILPGHLSDLLQIYPYGQTLLVDLRSPSEFAKSHIHRAVNLRVPLMFVQNTGLDMIDQAFTDDQSRRMFQRYHSAQCVVFYDRKVEYTFECPIADALHAQMKRHGWNGQCFVLKGHYREFSDSFEKYIVGNKMTQTAKDYVDSLSARPPPEEDGAPSEEERYAAWLELVESEGRKPIQSLGHHGMEERIHAVQEHEARVEAEFRHRFPALWKKAQGLAPVHKGPADVDHYTGKKIDNFESKAHLVAPLARGLEKMQHGAKSSSGSLPHAGEGYTDKLGEQHQSSEEFYLIDSGDEQDPGFPKGTGKATGEASGSGGEPAKKHRARGFLKMRWK